MAKKASAKTKPAKRAPAKKLGAITGDLISRRLRKLYTGIVHDIMRGMGLKDFTLPAPIRSFTVAQPIAGPVFTVRGRVDRNADPHETLLAWTGFLSQAKPGHVVVIQPNDDTVAHMGELSGETLMRKGIPGVVIDGGVRDVEFLIDMKLPVYAHYATPRDIVGYWLVDAMEVSITIGAVPINPGDFVIADRDGVIIVPRLRAEEIVAAAEKAVSTENKVRTAILAGTDPREAYLKYGKF